MQSETATAELEPAAGASSTGSRWLLAGVVLLATAYPPAMALHVEGLKGAFRYLAADAFYYLSVADHSSGLPYFTFDGSHATNGFHPLWQIYLERGFSQFGLEGGDQVIFALVSSIVLVSLGTALFSLVLLRLTRRPWLALLGAVPGFYYLAVPTLNAHHFAQWSFANGMESPLSIFFFGILLLGLFEWRWLHRAGSFGSLVLLSCVATAMVLSRLDDIFIFVPFVLWAALAGGSSRQTLRRLAAIVVVPSITIGLYLLYNVSHAESVLPSSGAAKVQPLWALARNLYALWMTTLPFADPLGRGVVAWSSEAWRILQMLVPAVAAAAWLLGQRMSLGSRETDREANENGLIGMLAVYVLVKAAYNFSMVGLWNQGQWYYPLSIMMFNLIAVVWIARTLDQRVRVRAMLGPKESGTLIQALQGRWPTIGRFSGLAAAVAATLLVLVTANAFVDLKQSGRHQTRSFEFWLERSATRHLLDENCPGCGVVAFDDGIVSYALEDTPTLNGLGLVMDREAREAQARGQLLDVAWERGHRLLVSVNYGMPSVAYSSRERLREYLEKNAHFADQDLDDWNFEVAFESPSTGVSFVRFEPQRIARGDRAGMPIALASGDRRSRRPSLSGEWPYRSSSDPIGGGARIRELRGQAPATAPVIPPLPRGGRPTAPLSTRPG